MRRLFQLGLLGVLLSVGAFVFLKISPNTFATQILMSYTGPNRLLSERHFEENMVPELRGKVAVVTGANTGIGKETARVLANAGAHVIVAARSKSAGETAANDIASTHPHAKLTVLELDLGSLQSIKKFVQELESLQLKSLDIVINNAGVMMCPFTLTTDGLEAQFGVNHVGHFYLVNQLLPILLKQKTNSRIVSVSSLAHWFPYPEGIRLTEESLNNASNYNPGGAYGQSKLANILFASELNSRLLSQGNDHIFVNSAHPGAVRSDLGRHVQKTIQTNLGEKAWDFFNGAHSYIQFPTLDGALTQLYLAASPEVESLNIRGKYYQPVAVQVVPSPLARDEQLAKKLWQFTEQIITSRGFTLNPL